MAYCGACMNLGCSQCNFGYREIDRQYENDIEDREEIPFPADAPIEPVDDFDPCGPDIMEYLDPGEYDPSEDIEDGYGGWQDDPCPEFDG
jgi:hypothetical protein